jgi:hypothetical protein
VPGARPVVAAVAVAESRATDAAPPVAEAMRQSACPPGADRTRNLSINDGRGVRRIEWADSRCEVEVRIEGEVTFNEDFTGFATISRGGLVRIREQGVGVDRLLEIRPSSGGSLDYAYRLSGNEAAFDAEAQAWLRGFVPELLRTSGLAADQRAAWLLRTQGPDGLFEEIGRLRSDRTQRLYLSAYLSAGPHDGAELSRAVRTAGAELGSDRELGRFLSDLSARDLGIAEVRSAFLEATSTLESDRELGQVLEGLMEGQELSQNEMQLVLEASLGIGSDRELSGVLMRVIEQGPLAEALRDPFMRALETIESDREYSRVATALLQSGV